MKRYVIFDKEHGQILHVHLVYGEPRGTSVTLEKKDVLSTLSDYFPEPEKVDVLAMDASQPLNLRKVRVNPVKRILEEIPSKEKEK